MPIDISAATTDAASEVSTSSVVFIEIPGPSTKKQ
jgi:hypothetical protein